MHDFRIKGHGYAIDSLRLVLSVLFCSTIIAGVAALKAHLSKSTSKETLSTLDEVEADHMIT